MSDTTPPPAPPVPVTAQNWPKLAVSILVLLTFAGLVAVTLVLKDQGNFTLLCGAAVAMAGTVVNFWLGTSVSSAQKDATIAQQATKQ